MTPLQSQTRKEQIQYLQKGVKQGACLSPITIWFIPVWSNKDEAMYSLVICLEEI